MVTKNRLKSEKFLKKNNFKFMRVNFDFNGSSIIYFMKTSPLINFTINVVEWGFNLQII